MRHLLLLALIYSSSFQLAFALDAISDGAQVIIYSDGFFDSVVSVAEKELGDDLKKRGIKFDDKGKKGSLLSDLVDGLEKDVLRKKPDYVFISIGMSEIADSKKKTLNPDVNTDTMIAQLRGMVETIQAAKIKVVLATPGLIGENIAAHSDLDQKLDEWSEKIRFLCKDLKIPCADFRALANTYLSSNNPEAKEKGILTKDGVKLSKEGADILAAVFKKSLGLVKSGIGRSLNEQDQVRVFDGCGVRFAGFVDPIDKSMTELFPNFAGIVRPSCKLVSVNDSFSAANAPSSQFTNQRPSVAILYLGERLKSATSAKAAYAVLFDEIKTIQNCDVFVCTIATDEASGSDTNTLFVEINSMLSELALERGFAIIDSYSLVEAKKKTDPSFRVKALGERPFHTKAFGAILETEIRKALGLATEE